MQLPTHLIIGITIQYVIIHLFPTSDWFLVGILIFILAFSSHFLLDALAKITYHPPVKQPGNFWLIWHLFAYSFGILLILIYINKFFLGMLAANLVDIWDWLFLRNYANRKNEPNWGKRYYLHPIADKVRSFLFSRLPNLNHTKIGILPESILYFGWFVIFIITLP